MPTYTIERFIEEANNAKSTREVAQLFGNALKEYGYDRFCYSLITNHPSLGLDAGHGVAENYPEDWMAHYKANRYEKKDPVPRQAFETLRPFTWELDQTDPRIESRREEGHERSRGGRAP